jgi:hypothetical protein
MATALAWARAAGADFPALSRELVPDSFAAGVPGASAERRGVEGSASLAWFSRSLSPGGTDPRFTGGELGGRGGAALLYGRYRLGGDATVDGEFNVDSREYPSRFYLGGEWRWISARVVAGLDEDRYGGTDLTIEFAPVHLGAPGHRPQLLAQAWVRGRRFDQFDEPILNPALELALRRVPLGGSTLDLAVSAQTDFARRNHPDSFGMLRAVWTPVVPAAEEDRLDSGPRWFARSTLRRALFLHAAYAFPLDTRHYARLALGGGVWFAMAFER